MFRAFKYLISFFSFLAPVFLHAMSDKIAASVDDQIITENDIKQRFQLLGQIKNFGSDFNFDEQIRSDLLNQLIEEKILSLIWKQQTTANFEICSKEEIDAFTRSFELENFSEKTVKDFFEKNRQRQIIAKEQFSRNTTVSEKEIETWLADPQNIQRLPLKASFKIAYSDEKLTQQQAAEQARSFHHLSVARAPSVIFSAGRWEHTDKWQFFEDQDEHVSVFIDDLSIEGALDSKFDAIVYFFDTSSALSTEDALAYHFDKILPSSVQSINTRSVSFTQRYQLPEAWADKNDFKVGDCQQVTSGETTSTFIIIEKISPLAKDQLREYLRENAYEQIIYSKVEDAFQLWLEQTRVNFYVDIKKL